MSELILYAYPVWALFSFVNGLIRVASHIYVEPDLQVLLKGLVYLGWSVAFFGAGFLITGAFDRAGLIAVVSWVWIVMLPIYAITTGVECQRFWHTLRMIARSRE